MQTTFFGTLLKQFSNHVKLPSQLLPFYSVTHYALMQRVFNHDSQPRYMYARLNLKCITNLALLGIAGRRWVDQEIAQFQFLVIFLVLWKLSSFYSIVCGLGNGCFLLYIIFF